MIDVWHIPIMGFTQKLDKPVGMDRLWEKLRTFKSHRNCIMIPQQWDTNWKAIAEFIWRHSQDHEHSSESPVINVYAYSWGAGSGFIKLAKALSRCGLVIANAVLCDPVYRSPIFPTWIPVNPLSLTRIPKIKIPTNVRNVLWTYQRVALPMGHQPVATSDRTVIAEGVEIESDHSHMDEQKGFHDLCISIAQQYVCSNYSDPRC